MNTVILWLQRSFPFPPLPCTGASRVRLPVHLRFPTEYQKTKRLGGSPPMPPLLPPPHAWCSPMPALLLLWSQCAWNCSSPSQCTGRRRLWWRQVGMVRRVAVSPATCAAGMWVVLECFPKVNSVGMRLARGFVLASIGARGARS
jgi:hypothetical protein